eukprot:TRINITY_DN27256_c2_g2_i1.p1 TRINITY_DN27256_c2_g2~~TRINITY_DN27256_c2_g2_i1.p1  ORF type:complete len:293 (-),score=48.61 TRINITY_DN27256_c2_g2_i1:434-1312(-)
MIANSYPTWKNDACNPLPSIGGRDSDSLASETDDEIDVIIDGGSSNTPCASTDSEISVTKATAAESEEFFLRPKRRWRLRCPLRPRFADATTLPSPDSYDVYEGKKESRSFVTVEGLLSEADLSALMQLIDQAPGVRYLRNKGRSADLVYNHEAFRIELPLRAFARDLYERLVQTLLWVDGELWGKLKPNRVVYPEIEYLVYDARKGKPAGIEPHVDNQSVVTAVILLSDSSDYEGGHLCVESAGYADDEEERRLRPEKGGAVIFRGEKLLHWVEPVTSGLRLVLQIELSRI